MATNKETREVEIIVQAQQANASIKELGAAAAIMRNQLEKMAADDPRRAKLAADYAAIRDRIKSTREENDRYAKSQIDVVVNGKKVEASFNEMNAAAKVLERQLHELSANDPGRAALLKDYTDLKKRINDVSTEMGTAQKSGGLLKNAWASAVGVFAGGGLLQAAQSVFGFLASSREEFAASAQAGAQLEATLKSTGMAAGVTKEQIEGIAEARAKVTLFDDDDTKGAASLLLTFTNIKNGVVQDALPAIQDLAQKMAGDGPADLKGASIQVGKALNDPIKGITALSRVGVSFSEDQKKVITQLVATGDTAGAQRIILAELNKEFGGSAEAARKAGGGMATLTMAFNETKESVGEFVTAGLNKASEWLGRVIDKAQPVIDIVSEMASEFGALYDDLYDVAVGLGLVDKNSDSAGTAVKVLTFAVTVLTTPIKLAAQLTHALVDGFVSLYNKSEVLRGALGGLGQYLSSFFTSIKDNALKALGGVADLLVGIFTLDTKKIKEGLAKTFGALEDQLFESGARAAGAFVDGYAANKDNKITRSIDVSVTANTSTTDNGVALPAEDDSLAAAAKEKADKAAEAAQRKREAAAKKIADAEEREFKARQKAGEAFIKGVEALEDARIASIADKRLREIEQINLDAIRKQRDVVGTEAETAQQLAAIEQERQEKQLAATEKYLKDQAALKKGNLDQALLEEDLAEQERERLVVAKFDEALIADAERDELLYEARKASLEKKLLLEEQYGQKESALYKSTLTALAKLEAQHNKENVENTKKREDAKRQIEMATIKFTGDVLALTIDLLSRDEKARKKNADIIKAFTAAKVVTDGIQEVQAIWRNANSNPINALIPGAGPALAAVETALAVGRTAFAVSTIRAQQFFSGGATGGGMAVRGGQRAVSGLQAGPVMFDVPGLHVGADGRLKDQTGAAIAGVVHENEWVMPAWMRNQPDIAPIEQHLEARRLRGFADGGGTSGPAMAGMLNQPATDPRLINVLERLDTRLEGVEAWPSVLDVRLSTVMLEEELERRKKVRLDSQVRP